MQASKSLHIYLCKPYTPNVSLLCICMNAIYIFAAFFWPFICIV